MVRALYKPQADFKLPTIFQPSNRRELDSLFGACNASTILESQSPVLHPVLGIEPDIKSSKKKRLGLLKTSK